MIQSFKFYHSLRPRAHMKHTFIQTTVWFANAQNCMRYDTLTYPRTYMTYKSLIRWENSQSLFVIFSVCSNYCMMYNKLVRRHTEDTGGEYRDPSYPIWRRPISLILRGLIVMFCSVHQLQQQRLSDTFYAELLPGRILWRVWMWHDEDYSIFKTAMMKRAHFGNEEGLHYFCFDFIDCMVLFEYYDWLTLDSSKLYKAS